MAITSLLFLFVGDLMTTVVGGKFGRRRIFNRSLGGSLACLVSCLLIGIVITKVGAETVLPIALAEAVSATSAELLPVLVNDDFTIPILGPGIMTLAMFWPALDTL